MIVGMVLAKVRQRLIGAAFDATGMGWTVAEEMGRIFGLRENDDGAGLIWAIKFSEEWYRVNMPPLKTAFEDDMIAIAPDDEHLGDIRAVKVVRGIPRVPVSRAGEKDKKRHGDYLIALALAHFASRMRAVEYGYRGMGDADRGGQNSGQNSGRMRDFAPQDEGQSRDFYAPPLGSGLRGSV